MARKSTFSPDDIVQAGFRLVDKKGRDQLTARQVAQELGSSTAPVYSNFSNMEDLEKALFEEAGSRLLKATQSADSDNKFLDMGMGVLDFAWKHPRWYEALFLVKNTPENHDLKIMEALLKDVSILESFEGLDISECTIVLKKMAIFTHGLATEICISGGSEHSREEWRILLAEVGETIVRDAHERTPRSPLEIELLGSLCDCSNPQPFAEEED